MRLPNLITFNQAATILAISLAFVHRLVYLGQLQVERSTRHASYPDSFGRPNCPPYLDILRA